MLTRARDHWLRSNGFCGQRIGLVESRELRCPRAFAFTKGPLVDAVAQLADGWVQFLYREELPMPKRRDDPAFGQLYARFDLGLFTRLVGPRRNHAHALVHGHLLIRGVQVGIVAARFGHAGLGVIWDHQLRKTWIELEGPPIQLANCSSPVASA